MNINYYRRGIAAILGCSVLWGILPLYWQALRPIPSDVIIFYRVFLVALICFVISLKVYGIKEILKPLNDRWMVVRTVIAGLLVTTNWSLYIWSVNADHVIQTCIGYYIEPLMICLFGVVFFREKLEWYKSVSLLFALMGLVVILVHFGEFPGIALGLSVSFGAYAALKKTCRMPALISLFYETVALMPIAFIVIIRMEIRGEGAIGVGEPYQYVLLLFCGILTAIPLGLFAYGALLCPLTTLGILEYISPSISLLLGIFVLGEAFDAVQLIAFIIIWIGLCFFTGGEIKNNGKNIQ